MPEKLYKVIFEGEITGIKRQAEVKLGLAALLKTDPATVEKLFLRGNYLPYRYCTITAHDHNMRELSTT